MKTSFSSTRLPHSIEPLESRIAPANLASLDLASLDGTKGFKLSSATDNDQAGFSVSSAGDVNGDGFADFIIGAPDPVQTDAQRGSSYVVFGKAGSFGAAFDLSTLDGTNGFKITGGADGDVAGIAVSGGGDVNHDGFADLLVGATGADEGGSQRGATYVIFGKAKGFTATLALSALDGANGFKISGVADGDVSGRAISSAGDVNGDGFTDILIGANGAAEGGTSRGAGYVVFGKSTFGASFDLSSLDGMNGFKMSGVADGDSAGLSVSGAGDVNGDGFADVVIGAYHASEGGNQRGASYVVFGKANGFTPTLALSSLNGTNGFKISGGTDGDVAGFSVSGAGDVNGDGVSDLLIGAIGANEGGFQRGASYVVFGKESAFSPSISLSALNGTNGFKISGVADNDVLGHSVSAAGDVNGDGYADLILGANGADEGGTNRGAAYVVYGKAKFDPALALSALNGTNGFKLSGVADGDQAGWAVSSAGDVNHDGFADLLIGAPNAAEGGAGRGASYVVYGHHTEVAPTISALYKNIATYTDDNGDLVTVTTSKGDLTGHLALFAKGKGAILDTLDLSDSTFVGANVSVTAKVSKTNGGDGFAYVRHLDASGHDLGIVKIGGDVTQIDAGDNIFTTPAVKTLTVQSFGGAVALPTSSLFGGTGNISVKTDVYGVRIDAIGAGSKFGNITIGGSLESAGLPGAGFYSDGPIGAVKIGKNFGGADGLPVAIAGKTLPGARSHVAIKSVTVGGNVEFAQILGGYDSAGSPSNADAQIGAVAVGGNWKASSIAAGVRTGQDTFFGDQNDALIASNDPAIFSRIASILIKGTLAGTEAQGDSFGFDAQQIGKLQIGAGKITPADNLGLTPAGDVRIQLLP